MHISVVSYANSIPFYYGLKKLEKEAPITLKLKRPSDIASDLLNGRTDIGLVPVAILPALRYYEIISNYCISADNKSKTVLLVSNEPIHKIKKIILDNDSRTSIVLAQILAKKHWNLQVEWQKRDIIDLRNLLDNKTAAVLIGDKAFKAENRFEYQFDLAEEWKKITGLPFVFACWVSNKKIEPEWKTQFNNALAFGLNNLGKAIEADKLHQQIKADFNNYLTKNISFNLTGEKRKSIDLFLSYKKKLETDLVM